MSYTSNYLDNESSTSDRIVFYIKTKGPASTAVLAQTLGMTPEAARLQVQKLVTAGLIEGRQEAGTGVGRPRQHWALTDVGHSRFPDTHAQLTMQLIGSVRQLFGEEGLDRLITQRETESQALYAQQCDGPSWEVRLAQLAELRTREGYMARVEQIDEGWLLIEDHCPICAAARTCQGFCRSELQLFQFVLGGGVTIRREEHLLSDARRCVYRVTAATAATTAV